MSQTPLPAPQSPPQAETRQNMQREMLARLLWLAVIALILILIFAITPPILTVITYVRSSSTASPSPTATVSAGQLQDLSNRAEQQLMQSNSLLTLMTSFATVLGVVLAVFTVVAVGLGAFGFFTNNGFRDLEEKWRQAIVSVENKGKDIGQLQEDVRQKQKDIDKLQEETREKQKNIDVLQQTLESLREKMQSGVAALETQFQDTNRALTQLILGNQLLEQGRREQAIEAFEKAQKLRPKDPQINYALGRAYSGVGAYDEAIHYLGIASDIDQNFPQAHMELGLAYRRRGNRLYEEFLLEEEQEKKEELHSRAEADYEQAIKHLARAIELSPDYEDALATLGGLYRRLGDYENRPEYYRRALECYEKASQADPNSSYASGNIASLSWYLGKSEEALTAFACTKKIAEERIARLVRPAEVYWDYYDLALAQLALGEKEQARETYVQAIEKTPGRVDLDGVLSNLYLLRKADKLMVGLDEVIKMVEDAKAAHSKK